MAAQPKNTTIVDHRFFVRDDSLSLGLTTSTGPHVGGLSSKSVRDCRLSASASPTIRCASATGITGGRVEGAKVSDEERATMRPGKCRPQAKKAARKSAKRAASGFGKRASRF